MNCSLCNDFGLVHPRRPDGTVDYGSLIYCRCRGEKAGQLHTRSLMQQEEPERYVPVTPDMIDFPVSWDYIKSEQEIIAREFIEAGTVIKAGEYIEAGCEIIAGEYIEAGWGIKAGAEIEAGGDISVKGRIFAGLMMWKKPDPHEMEIRCRKLKSGEVAYGKLIEC